MSSNGGQKGLHRKKTQGTTSVISLQDHRKGLYQLTQG